MNRLLVVTRVCPAWNSFPALSWLRTLFYGAVSAVPGVRAGLEGPRVCGASSCVGTKSWWVATSTWGGWSGWHWMVATVVGKGPHACSVCMCLLGTDFKLCCKLDLGHRAVRLSQAVGPSMMYFPLTVLSIIKSIWWSLVMWCFHCL